MLLLLNCFWCFFLINYNLFSVSSDFIYFFVFLNEPVSLVILRRASKHMKLRKKSTKDSVTLWLTKKSRLNLLKLFLFERHCSSKEYQCNPLNLYLCMAYRWAITVRKEEKYEIMDSNDNLKKCEKGFLESTDYYKGLNEWSKKTEK